jgi:hypothetical protein
MLVPHVCCMSHPSHHPWFKIPELSHTKKMKVGDPEWHFVTCWFLWWDVVSSVPKPMLEYQDF